eukprot:scaffold169851_cov33-Tisochrysis_lutea.AAC.1
MDSIADEYVCPITAELPLDPVTAEDGRVYERSAIERWLKSGRQTSPVTNNPMGSRLLPSHQVRASIEKLVRTGTVIGYKADRWRERIDNEEMVNMWRRRADAGDAPAMVMLGTWYHCGKMGLEKSHEKGFHWCKRAADLGSVCGQASAGLCLVGGKGVEANVAQGICLVSAAAAAGAEFAANWLGEWHAQGMYGLPKDLNQARYWFSKVVNGSCAYTEIPGYRNRAAERLAAIDASGATTAPSSSSEVEPKAYDVYEASNLLESIPAVDSVQRNCSFS